VKEVCNEASVLLKYLPAYSPDFNLIEPSFHLLKQWMRRYASLSLVYREDLYEEKFEAFLFTAIKEFQIGTDFRGLFQKSGVRVE
jgi:hypothetical protein